MPVPDLIAFAVLLLVLLVSAATVYGGTLRFLVQRGGRVNPAGFGLADLFTASMLAVSFIALIAAALATQGGAPVEMNVDHVLPGQLLNLIVVAGILAFLHYRRADLAALFGLRLLPPARAIGVAIVFILAAFPIVSLVNWLTVSGLGRADGEQELVSLFRRIAAGHEYAAIGKLVLATVIIAPVCEEFLFRGYFYAVGKRYVGSLASGLCMALLFAAFHTNLQSLPGLFVLALCLTAAYERTGSLLVPIGMHTLYNGSSLALLYLQSQGALPSPP